MKSLLVVLIIALAVTANPSPSLPVHPGVGGFYKGPNSETIIKGPDGSVITAASVGGEVHTKLEPIVVAEPAVVQEVVPVPSVTPLIETTVPIVETVEINAPIIETNQNSDLVGPSGIISTRGSHSVVAGPASTTITGPVVLGETVVKGTPFVASNIPVSRVVDHGTIASLPVVPTADSVALSSAPQASASASASPHHSVATASSSSSAVVTATAGPNAASASVKTLPVHTVISPPAISTPLPIISSTVRPLIYPNSVSHANRIAINGHVDLSETNRIYLPSNTLAPPVIAASTVRASPVPSLVSGTIGKNYIVSSTPAPAVAINPVTISALNAHPVGSPVTVVPPSILSTLASNHVDPLLSSNIQRIETDSVIKPGLVVGTKIQPVHKVALSESEQIVLAQQQALLRNEVKTGSNLVHVTSRPDLISHTISTLNAAQEQAILNEELARHGIDPLKLHLTSVPWAEVGEFSPDWIRYGRDVDKEEKQDDKIDEKN